MADKSTTIWIKQRTKELLDTVGKKGETYDEILNRLVLNSKKIKLDMQGRNLYRQGVEARPLFVGIPYHAALQNFAWKSSVTFFYGSKNYSYWDADIVTAKGKQLLAQHLETGNHLQGIIQKWKKLVEQQKKVEKTIKDLKNVHKKKDQELTKTLHDYVHLVKKNWDIGITIELFDPDSESIILEVLNKYDKSNLTIKEFKVLCSPETPSNIQQELLDLYCVAHEHDKNKKDTLLQKHAEQFFWIKNTWADARLLDKQFFKEKLKRLDDEGIDFKEEQQKIIESCNALKKEKETILEKKKKLHTKVQRTIDFFHIMTEWREKRKKYALISNHFIDLLITEICNRAQVPKRLLWFALADEISLPLSEDFVTELQKRTGFCMMYLDEHGQPLLKTGKEYFDFAKNLKESQQQQGERLYGNTANPGKVEGTAKIIFTTQDIPKMEQGDVLVAPCTRPEYVPAMKKASAILTDEGGITSHAAIVSRELGVPCIVGLRNATDILKDGDTVLVNANHGIVQLKKKE